MKEQAEIFDSSNNYQKGIRFADEELKSVLAGYIEYINVRNATARLDGIYAKALSMMEHAYTESAFKEAEAVFRSILHHKDAAK